AFTRRAASGILAGVAILTLVLFAQRVEAPTLPGEVAQSITSAPDDFASQAWGTFLRSSPALMQNAYVLKIPTWMGLLGLIICSCYLAARRPVTTVTVTRGVVPDHLRSTSRTLVP